MGRNEMSYAIGYWQLSLQPRDSLFQEAHPRISTTVQFTVVSLELFK